MSAIDLHTHSTASDGTCTPTEIVRRASEIGIAALAVTDHDTIDGVEEAVIAGKIFGVEVIPGVEMSVDYDGTYEILGYGIDYADQKFQDMLRRRQEWRKERIIETVKRLNNLGFEISMDEVIANAGTASSVGRPHVARVLVNKGYFPDVKTVFNELLLPGKDGYVSSKAYPKEAVVKAILRVGGVPVLAHPCLMNMTDEQLEEEVRQLKEYGLKGIEAYYSSSSPEQTSHFLEIARKYGLIATAGSDFHGANKKVMLGGINNGKPVTDYSIVKELKRLSGGYCRDESERLL